MFQIHIYADFICNLIMCNNMKFGRIVMWQSLTIKPTFCVFILFIVTLIIDMYKAKVITTRIIVENSCFILIFQN